MKEEKEEKLEEREIRFSTPKGEHRPKGKFLLWLDNYWYHNKWKTIGALFVAVVLTVCIWQMCSNDNNADITVMTAGPYQFVTTDVDLNAFKQCLASYLPEDFDGDGNKTVNVSAYNIYSEDEIKAAEASGEVYIDRSQNSDQFSESMQYIALGECSVLFLSPYLYEYLTSLTNCPLTDMTGYLESIPAGTVEKEGKIYGVKLCETEMYKNNSAVRQLPEDTLICLVKPGCGGKSSDETYYNQAVKTLNAFVK